MNFQIILTGCLVVHAAMNIPATPYTSQNGIVIQCRATPSRSDRANDHAYVIPPMTPVFSTRDPATRPNPRKGADVKDVHGQWLSSQYSLHPPTRETFVGVSIEGVAEGAKCRRFGDAYSRFGCVTRGLVTIMCDYGDVEKIPLGTHVKVIQGRNKFRGMPAAMIPFSLARLEEGENPNHAIGMLMGKPDMRHRTNEARVLLF